MVVAPDLGFPAGKNKTILVDLRASRAPASSGRVGCGCAPISRSTGTGFGWAEGVADADARRPCAWTRRGADLRYRGFSETRKERRDQPEVPVYDRIANTAPRWRDLVGYYTRFGDVRELLGRVDDRYVIMNAGDELRLSFPRSAAAPTGWTRDFVLIGDGWVKDGDYNTSFSKTVLPLPAHGHPDYAAASPRCARARIPCTAASRRLGDVSHPIRGAGCVSGRPGVRAPDRATRKIDEDRGSAAWALGGVDDPARRVARCRRGAEPPGLDLARRRADPPEPGPARVSPRGVGRERMGMTSRIRAPTFDARLAHIMPQIASTGAAAAVADFDRDGWQDFYVTNSAEGSLNRLYRNKGDGTFTDVAAAVGLADVNRPGTGVSMGARLGRLRQRRLRGSRSSTSTAGPSCFTTTVAARSSACPSAPDCPRGSTRTRRSGGTTTATAVSTSSLPATGRKARPLASRDDADHAREFRIRRERRPEVPVSQSRRRHVRGNVGSARDRSRAAGRSQRSRPICSARAIRTSFSRTTTASRALRQSRRETFVEVGRDTGVGRTPKSGMSASLGDIFNDGRLSIYKTNISEPGVLVQANDLWVPKARPAGAAVARRPLLLPTNISWCRRRYRAEPVEPDQCLPPTSPMLDNARLGLVAFQVDNNVPASPVSEAALTQRTAPLEPARSTAAALRRPAQSTHSERARPFFSRIASRRPRRMPSRRQAAFAVSSTSSASTASS